MISYLIHIISFQLLFFLIYKAFLHKETFFNWNRVYLLTTPVLACILPFVKIQIFKEVATFPAVVHQLPAIVIGGQETTITQLPSITIQATKGQHLDVVTILSILYALGVLCALILFIKKYKAVSRYYRFKQAHSNIITIPKSTTAFTFFNTVFIGADIDTLSRKQILAHECVHVKEKHGWDLLFYELLKIIFWFNPIVYLYQKSISELHEFIADHKATRKTDRSSYCNHMLNAAFGTQNISFINTFFNHSLIKKRLVMLQTQSRKQAKFKYLILFPLLLGMLFYISCSDETNDLAQNSDTSLEQQIAELRALIDSKEKLSKKEVDMLTSLSNKAQESIEVIDIDDVDAKATYQQEFEDIPFAVVEKVPAYPGCEDLANNDARKSCMVKNITTLVNKEFNTGLGKELGLQGINRVYVRFKIDKQGDVVDVEARAPHPKLEEEAKRVIHTLPKMTPGQHDGGAVGVLYSLPIIFKV